jgi:hypothetical protein
VTATGNWVQKTAFSKPCGLTKSAFPDYPLLSFLTEPAGDERKGKAPEEAPAGPSEMLDCSSDGVKAEGKRAWVGGLRRRRGRSEDEDEEELSSSGDWGKRASR